MGGGISASFSIRSQSEGTSPVQGQFKPNLAVSLPPASIEENGNDTFDDSGASRKSSFLHNFLTSPSPKMTLNRQRSKQKYTGKVDSDSALTNEDTVPRVERDRDRETTQRIPRRSSMNTRSSFVNENTIRSLVQEFSTRNQETSYIPPTTAFVAATNPRKLKLGSFAVVPQPSTTLSFIYSPDANEANSTRALSPEFDALYSHFMGNESVSNQFDQAELRGIAFKQSFTFDPGEREADESSATAKVQPFNSNPSASSTHNSMNNNNRAFRNNLGLKIELFSASEESSPSKAHVEEGNFNSSPAKWAASSNVEAGNDANVDNYKFSMDGTIYVGGMQLAIGTHGIIRPPSEEELATPKKFQRMHMKERLVVLSKLGQGASSIVYKALDLADLKLVALKMIHVNEKEKRGQLVKEVCALFQHIKSTHAKGPEKFIVDFYDAFSNPEDGIVLLMLEYMDGGSLQDIVDGGGCCDEATLASICLQAFSGLYHLHCCCQIHRDLKPGNLLISHRGDVKIADLGILKQLDGDVASDGIVDMMNLRDSVSLSFTMRDSITNLRSSYLQSQSQSSQQSQVQPQPRKRKNQASTTTFVGTATYMSPERIDGKEYSYPADIWAMGLAIMAVAMGRFPLESAPQGHSYWSLLQKIRDSPPPSLPADGPYSKDMRDFIDLCLRAKPEERPSCRQLLRHAFLKKAAPLPSEDEALSKNRDDHQRSISELHAIILAIYAHVKLLLTSKKHSLNPVKSPMNRSVGSFRSVQPSTLFGNNSSKGNSKNGRESADIDDVEKIFGESIADTHPAIILQKILFGEVFTRQLSRNFQLSGPTAVSAAKKRLKTLAHQLYMPLDMLLHEVESFYAGLLREACDSCLRTDELTNLDD